MLPVAATQTLPGLVQRAASQLASATSAAEVLEARDAASAAYTVAKATARLAKAKGAHDELIAKAHRAQADALEIEAMAKRRLADEYDAAQERGEVSKQGQRTDIIPDGKKVPLASEIGLNAKDIHEARQIRDAEETSPGVVRETLDAALEAGEEPTKAAVRRAVERPRKSPVPAYKQLEKLRRAWREASPTIRQHFLAEITERAAA